MRDEFFSYGVRVWFWVEVWSLLWHSEIERMRFSLFHLIWHCIYGFLVKGWSKVFCCVFSSVLWFGSMRVQLVLWHDCMVLFRIQCAVLHRSVARCHFSQLWWNVVWVIIILLICRFLLCAAVECNSKCFGKMLNFCGFF